ncbi:hypothetical protein SFC55_23780 [Niallia taxi]|uniref:anti-sigma factor family protein n=1 Tax=Niallia taxi TaxID=2499688 RepID=UPI00398216B5
MITHYSFEQWQEYAKDELDEGNRSQMEDHLYGCDHCLDLYVQAVEAQEQELPSISDVEGFTDQIMQKITQEQAELMDIPVVKPKKKKSFYQSSIFHYAIAASITLVLMTTGVFQSIIKHTESIQKAEMPMKQEEVKVGFVDKTFSWLNTFDGSMSMKEEKKK